MENKKIVKTKTSEILKYLKSHKKGITSLEAITHFGATRLSAIIFELRKDGHNIVMDWEEGTDMYGHKMRYGRYRLV